MQQLIDTTEIKDRFDLDGFVNFGRILNDDELEIFSERIDAICDGTVTVPQECLRMMPGWQDSGKLRQRDGVWQILNVHLHDDVVLDISTKAAIQEMIELLIEGPARLWSTQVIMKPAHHGGVIPWHQDTSYWGQEKRMTCWLAIDDATPFNGCMRMIPGSHRHGQLKFTEKEFVGAAVPLLEADGINEDTLVYVPVPRGCASFHHPLILHGSDANTTAHRRRAIAITYEKE